MTAHPLCTKTHSHGGGGETNYPFTLYCSHLLRWLAVSCIVMLSDLHTAEQEVNLWFSQRQEAIVCKQCDLLLLHPIIHCSIVLLTNRRTRQDAYPNRHSCRHFRYLFNYLILWGERQGVIKIHEQIYDQQYFKNWFLGLRYAITGCLQVMKLRFRSWIQSGKSGNF